MHPGFSLELLAGANVEAKKFGRAEGLELAVLALRRSIVGEKNELVAAAYANLGDFYHKAERKTLAEAYYARAIKLTQELRLPQGYGSPMTKLGILYKEEGRFADAQQAFNEALRIRTQIFGAKSAKVAETLEPYIDLLKVQGRTDQVDSFQRQLSATHSAAQQSSKVQTSILPLIVSLLSLCVFFYRDRFIVYAANVARVKTSRK
jgi:tetratricopeptide (TPR) repeat protein